MIRYGRVLYLTCIVARWRSHKRCDVVDLAGPDGVPHRERVSNEGSDGGSGQGQTEVLWGFHLFKDRRVRGGGGIHPLAHILCHLLAACLGRGIDRSRNGER